MNELEYIYTAKEHLKKSEVEELMRLLGATLEDYSEMINTADVGDYGEGDSFFVQFGVERVEWVEWVEWAGGEREDWTGSIWVYMDEEGGLKAVLLENELEIFKEGSKWELEERERRGLLFKWEKGKFTLTNMSCERF